MLLVFVSEVVKDFDVRAAGSLFTIIFDCLSSGEVFTMGGLTDISFDLIMFFGAESVRLFRLTFSLGDFLGIYIFLQWLLDAISTVDSCLFFADDADLASDVTK